MNIRDGVNINQQDSTAYIKNANKRKHIVIVVILIAILIGCLVTSIVVISSRKKSDINTRLTTSTTTVNTTIATTINTTEKQVKLSKEEYLKCFIELPHDDYDKGEVKNITYRIGLFDIKLLKLICDRKGVVILTSGPITDDERYSYLKGVVPRGWENTGSTWDDIPGAGGYPNTIVRIGKSFPSPENNHGTIVLELHEISHMIDQILNNPSASEEFIKLSSEESKNLFPGSAYMKISEEYWAEALAYYTYSDETRTELRDYAPKTYNYFTILIDNLE